MTLLFRLTQDARQTKALNVRFFLISSACRIDIWLITRQLAVLKRTLLEKCRLKEERGHKITR